MGRISACNTKVGCNYVNIVKADQYLPSLQSYVLVSKSTMAFDLVNPRWPSQKHIFAKEADTGIVFFLMIPTLWDLTSYLIVILARHTCLPVEEKIHILISAFTKRTSFYVLLVPLFMPLYFIMLFSKSYGGRFIIFTQFWGEYVIERGTSWKKILRSFQGHFCIPIGFLVDEYCEIMKMNHKDMPIIYTLQFRVWAIWPHSVNVIYPTLFEACDWWKAVNCAYFRCLYFHFRSCTLWTHCLLGIPWSRGQLQHSDCC